MQVQKKNLYLHLQTAPASCGLNSSEPGTEKQPFGRTDKPEMKQENSLSEMQMSAAVTNSAVHPNEKESKLESREPSGRVRGSLSLKECRIQTHDTSEYRAGEKT